jgi:hypothetical protein
MSAAVSLDVIVLDLCEREWRRRQQQGETKWINAPVPPLHQVAERICPMRVILPSLTRLLRQQPHRPVAELAPTIRRLVEERDFVDECGDPCIDLEHERLTGEYVDLLVNVLERVRQHNLSRSEWSEAPVTPQMFG